MRTPFLPGRYLRDMSTEQTRTAPYGSWVSPIKLDDVVAAGASMSSLIGDGADLWWLETLPD